jgi:predicted lipoprotein with Yx(FWY)xxD motif
MKKQFLVLWILIILGACIAGCATTQPPATPTPTPTATTSPPGVYTIQTATNAQLGTYLANTNGLALYYFADDVPGSGTTACNTSICLSLWTPFTPTTMKISPSLDASQFGTISISSGNQVTYRGWPLYTYNSDTRGAAPAGEGFRGIWYVMKPDYSVMIMENSKTGRYLSDSGGMTVYNFSPDSSQVTTCFNDTNVLVEGKTCLQLWPPFAPSPIVAPSGVNTADFTTFTRADGSMQVAYRGWPLYYFVLDTAPGQMNGGGLVGFGGTWHVVPPDVAAAPPSATATSTPSPTPTQTSSSSGGGYGY